GLAWGGDRWSYEKLAHRCDMSCATESMRESYSFLERVEGGKCRKAFIMRQVVLVVPLTYDYSILGITSPPKPQRSRIGKGFCNSRKLFFDGAPVTIFASLFFNMM